eukprot:GDKH01002531.1.p3 GENE.GDKH01002531.1~~GDKH01002531.1.p3  ORF type:complete len:117 (+),score=10.24 GDKH01002531.1:598-948(+)
MPTEGCCCRFECGADTLCIFESTTLFSAGRPLAVRSSERDDGIGIGALRSPAAISPTFAFAGANDGSYRSSDSKLRPSGKIYRKLMDACRSRGRKNCGRLRRYKLQESLLSVQIFS